MNNLGIVSNVTSDDLIAGIGSYLTAMEYASLCLKLYRIFDYKDKEYIISETMPSIRDERNYKKVLIMDIETLEEIEIDILKFLNNSNVTEYVLDMQ